MLCCYGWLIWPVVIGVCIAALVSLILRLLSLGDPSRPAILENLRGKHVLITGGSKGIGRALAVEAVKLGADVVTIIARDQRQLDDAYMELSHLSTTLSATEAWRKPNGPLIQAVSLDLTSDYENIRRGIRAAEESASHPIDILINNAGGSVDGEFDKLPVEAFEKQMRLNYLSAVYTTRAVVESMKQRPKDHCRIVFVSSQAGQIGIYGYGAYSPTKFALRGLAEVLRMELKMYNIFITISFPPNTRTEGFVDELKQMPEATKRISGDSDAQVFEPSQVAAGLWKDIQAGRYQSVIGMDGWMLGILSSGTTPCQNGDYWELLQQSFFAGIFRLLTLFYLRKFDSIAAECRLAEDSTAKQTVNE